MPHTRVLAALVAGLIFVVPSSALAQSSASDAYGGQGALPGQVATPPAAGVTGSSVNGSSVNGNIPSANGGVRGLSESGGSGTLVTRGAGSAGGTANGQASGTAPSAAASGATAPSGGLPFTGLDTALLAAIGVLLFGLGVVVRRLSRDPLSSETV